MGTQWNINDVLYIINIWINVHQSVVVSWDDDYTDMELNCAYKYIN